MIVQCPSCASRYRVNDANVPSSGGKITCPSCQHKFIVYPEEQAPASSGADSNDMEDKTSVAFRPDLNKLVNQMQQGGQAEGAPSGGADAGHSQAGGAQSDNGVAATEVMSGDQIPDFLSGQTPGDDGTVEMKNPFEAKSSSTGQTDVQEADVAATEVVSGDLLDDFSFDGPAGPQPPKSSPQQNERSSKPSPHKSQPSEQAPAHQGAPQGQKHLGSQEPFSDQEQSLHEDPPSAPPAADAAATILEEDLPEPADPQGAQAPFDDAEALTGPDPDHEGPWKLETNFGLTYEFPDSKSLKNWLSSREELDGYELSGDGDNFHPLDAWPQISGEQDAPAGNQQPASFHHGASPAAQPPSSGPDAGGNAGAGGSAAAGLPGNPLTPSTPPPNNPSSPSNPSPPNPSRTPREANGPRKKIQPNEYRPPSRDGKWNVLLWGIVAVLMLVAGGLIVQTAGIFDIKGELLGADSTAQAKSNQQAAGGDEQLAEAAKRDEAAAEGADENAVNPKIAKEVTRLVTDAERAVDNNRLQTAAEKLQNAKLLDPKRVEVYEMLADVYGQMGQDEEAEAAAAKAGELELAAQDGANPADGVVAGEEASKN